MSESVSTSWTTARLIEPSSSGYVFVGVSSGPWRFPRAIPSRRRRQVLDRLHRVRRALASDPAVLRADVFRGTLRPPGGQPGFDGQFQGDVAYDAVLLVETASPAEAAQLARGPEIAAVRAERADAVIFSAGNVRRIGPVDHERRGVFLFNFFTADDVATNLHAWQYTAGWFQDETGLDNSTVLEPAAGTAPFTLVNHCRWDHYAQIVPSLIAKRSFRSFVLRVFAEHRVAPHPVLYALDRPGRRAAVPR